MNQKTFTDAEYNERKHKTKREEFLDKMDSIIPWDEWVSLIEPYYPKGKRGRPPMGIEKMLRMYLLQCWFSLSDVGVEDAMYDSYAFKKFSRIDFLSEQVPDATTLLKFRKLLVDKGINEKIFNDVNMRLEKAGLMVHGGTVVDATIIAAAKSTKNREGKRDEEMHQTKKGNEWHFGMKVHSGCDAQTGYVHTVTATAANAHDITEAHKLIRDDDDVVYGDSGYLGIEKREEIKGDGHLSKVEFKIAKRPSSLKSKLNNGGIDWDREIERRKASVRSKIEWPHLVVKRQFGYCRAAYRGLRKNLNRFYMLFASVNLLKVLQGGRAVEFCAVSL